MNIKNFRLVDRRTGQPVQSRKPRQARKAIISASNMVDTRNAALYMSPATWDMYTRNVNGYDPMSKFSRHLAR